MRISTTFLCTWNSFLFGVGHCPLLIGMDSQIESIKGWILTHTMFLLVKTHPHFPQGKHFLLRILDAHDHVGGSDRGFSQHDASFATRGPIEAGAVSSGGGDEGGISAVELAGRVHERTGSLGAFL